MMTITEIGIASAILIVVMALIGLAAGAVIETIRRAP